MLNAQAQRPHVHHATVIHCSLSITNVCQSALLATLKLVASARHAKLVVQPVSFLRKIVSLVTDLIYSLANAMKRALSEPPLTIRNSNVSDVDLVVTFAIARNLMFAYLAVLMDRPTNSFTSTKARVSCTTKRFTEKNQKKIIQMIVSTGI